MTRLSGDDQKGGGEPTVWRFDGRRFLSVIHTPVPEMTVALTVNGVPVATLFSSPHDLHYLVAGFLRLQGVLHSPGDLLSLAVCENLGSVSVRIRGGAPDRLPRNPVPCPGGPTPSPDAPVAASEPADGFSPDAVIGIMEMLSRPSEGGGGGGEIHRAAAGDGLNLLVSAEDTSLPATVDRIAGEALLKGIGLGGRILAVSGRVSLEVASRAAALGVSVVVSRDVPTEPAIRHCASSGVTLVGCVQGRRFNVYSHPERIASARSPEKIRGVTGAILSGGPSRRMGCDKALLPYRGGRFLEAIHRKLAEIFEEVIVVGAAPEQYDFLPCRRVPDIHPGMGALAGIHSALHHSGTDRVFVVACDMPHIRGELIRQLCALGEDADAVVPEGAGGPVPLHAVYGKGALPAIEEALRSGLRDPCVLLERVRVRRVGREAVERIDPGLAAFRNINTPQDYFRFRRSLEPLSGRRY